MMNLPEISSVRPVNSYGMVMNAPFRDMGAFMHNALINRSLLHDL